MAEVVALKTVNGSWNDSVNTEIVEVLEMWLAEAKAGKFDGVAVCGVLRDGSVETNAPSHNQHPALIGAVWILQQKLTQMGG